MESKILRYLLFPHTVVSERNLRRLALFLPQLSILQVIRPPVLPEWAVELVTPWPVVQGKERIDRIDLSLKGYREFAGIHGENALLASMSHEQIAKDTRETRILIQSELRGKTVQTPGTNEDLLLEAGIFLELARDLDEKEMELEGGFAQIESLESKFRDILGIVTEEEVREAEETLSPPLKHERSHLSFALSKRIASWLRLLSASPAEGIPVLLTVLPEAVEEAMEPLRHNYERGGDVLGIVQLPLFSGPDLAHLDSRTFSDLYNELRGSSVLQTYHRCVEEVVKMPENSTLMDELQKNALVLRTDIIEFCEEHQCHSDQEVRLSLIHVSGITIDDLWTKLDPDGRRALGKDCPFLKCPLTFLSLT